MTNDTKPSGEAGEYREWWICFQGFDVIVRKTLAELDKVKSRKKNAKELLFHVIEFAAVERLREELAEWKRIEELSGCTRQEIYGNVYKLKKGKYGPKAKIDLPCCDPNVPMNRKIHDDLCDHLEDKGYNGADVCTASVGIWATIKVCSDLFAKERDQLRSDLAAAYAALERWINATKMNKKNDDPKQYEKLDRECHDAWAGLEALLEQKRGDM